jgi:hypothetical protein
VNRHELELELQGTQLIVTALLLEINRPFHVTDAKLAEASKWLVDAEVKNGEDILFLTPKGTDNG